MIRRCDVWCFLLPFSMNVVLPRSMKFKDSSEILQPASAENAVDLFWVENTNNYDGDDHQWMNYSRLLASLTRIIMISVPALCSFSVAFWWWLLNCLYVLHFCVLIIVISDRVMVTVWILSRNTHWCNHWGGLWRVAVLISWSRRVPQQWIHSEERERSCACVRKEWEANFW